MYNCLMKLITNYHTHTYRCGHAQEINDEEYVKKAIACGFKELGFSDHGPFKGIHHEGMRMDFEEIQNYLNSINSLKEKYKDQIKIYVGFEIEYIPRLDSYYKELYEKYKVDYLILGQHFTYNEKNEPSYYWPFFAKDNIFCIKRYVADLISGIKSGYYKYVAHPDFFINHVSVFSDEIKDLSLEIINVSIEMNIPLEINLNGYLYNRFGAFKNGCLFYPSVEFFKLAKENNAKFIIGVDAHRISQFEDIPYEFLDEFFKETGINEKDIIQFLFE